MKEIYLKDIIIDKFIKSTDSSYVMSCKYNNHEYCYKELLVKDDIIVNNISNLTKFKIKKGLILPKYIVTNDGNFMGYLSKLLINSNTLEEIKNLSLDEKIKILNDVKEKIEIMHKEYGIIHGDLHTRNICVSQNLVSSIIDFDLVSNKEKLTFIARKYIENNSYDYDLDKYIFNLTSYSFINDIKFRDVIWAISSEYSGNFKNSKAKKELNSLVKYKKPSNYLINLI